MQVTAKVLSKGCLQTSKVLEQEWASKFTTSLITLIALQETLVM